MLEIALGILLALMVVGLWPIIMHVVLFFGGLSLVMAILYLAANLEKYL